MFYYFGRKKRLAGHYPDPSNSRIIEPFAGSGAYSLHGERWRNEVWLNDRDPAIRCLWSYLQAATRRDIEALPTVQPGERLSTHTALTPDERLLISLHAGPGKNRNNDVVSKFSRWGAGQRYIASNIHKIKHWQITSMDYADMAVTGSATWFIDPPYQRSGRLYRFHDVDYAHLAEWTRCRSGLLIVCEQRGADWLPFEPLASIHCAGRHISHELIYTQTR